MSHEEVGWLVLRLVYAWIFLYPVSGLVRDWAGTVSTTSLLFSWKPGFFASVSLLVMLIGAMSILFGIYGQIGALGLLGFNLGGSIIHFRLAESARNTKLSAGASSEDVKTVEQLAALGAVGHTTSALKNFVLAAVAFFFMAQGTGPWSLIP